MTTSDFPSKSSLLANRSSILSPSSLLPKAPTTLPPDDETVPTTNPLVGAVPARPQHRIAFAPNASAILHFSQAGTILSLSMDKPTVLGRGTAYDTDDKVDLTDFNAYQLGVSRFHCQLKRGKYNLTVTDLGSANGTFLNEERLMPSTTYNVEHGDILRLGSLAITVLFSTANTQ